MSQEILRRSEGKISVTLRSFHVKGVLVCELLTDSAGVSSQSTSMSKRRSTLVCSHVPIYMWVNSDLYIALLFKIRFTVSILHLQ